MQQCVHRSGQLLSPSGPPVVRGEDGSAHHLSAAAAAVWMAADGQRDAAGLLAELRAVEADAALERVFGLLDELSEQGLVAGRLAPPTEGVDRRGMFRRFAFGAAAAVVAAPVLAQAGKARAAAPEICLDDMAFHSDEQKAKKLWSSLDKDASQEMKQKQKLDEELAKLKEQAEERVKGGKDTDAIEAKIGKEQKAKQSSEQSYKGQSESSQKAKKVQPGGDTAQEEKCKDVTRARRFGVGPSAIFIDLPGDEVFESRIELGDVVMDGDEKSCTLSFRLVDSGLSVSGGNLEAFDKVLLELRKSGTPVGLQWGTAGEFAALGPIVDSSSEIASFDAETGKPRRRWTHIAISHRAGSL